MDNLKKFLVFFGGIAALYVLAILISKGFGGRKSFILAHNLDESHPVHKGMEYFANQVKANTGGKYIVQIFPNGQFGREREVIELLQLGAVTMTKVSSLSLEAFVPHYAAINLPYLFRSKEHFFAALDGEIGQLIHTLGVERQFRGLTYYDSGSRSFYTHKPINSPEDLKGLKIRVMASKTSIEMLKLLGGSPTPMSYGEIYTALQQNVIDGAENNITALTLSRHGEVAKHYSLDEHIMAPDVLIISEKIWSGLEAQDQQIFKDAAEASARHQRKLWKEMTFKMQEDARNKMGVTFHFPDKEPFMELVLPLHEKAAQRDELFNRIIEEIKSYD